MQLYKISNLLQLVTYSLFLNTLNFLIFFLTDFIYIYKLLCNTRIMLRWFPALEANASLYYIIIYLTDPYFNFWKSLFKPMLLSSVHINPLPLIYINFINYLFYIVIYILKIIYKMILAKKNLL